MKQYFVTIGDVYMAKVSNKIARVRVDRKAERFRANGQSRTVYHCTNLDTGRQIIVKSAQRFRNEVKLDQPKGETCPDCGEQARACPECGQPTCRQEGEGPCSACTERLATIIDQSTADTTEENVGEANRNDGDYVQERVNGLVHRYGSNLHDWPEFNNVVHAAGLDPQDVTDERLATASLKLHNEDAAWRERMKENNENPLNLRVVFKGDPEFDPMFPTTKENDMAKKKLAPPPAKATTRKPEPTEGKAKKREPKADGKMSALDAAAKILGETKKPMNCKDLIAAMEAKGYWTSPGGKTPEATLSAAISTEIRKKGDASRFAKASPGHFTLQK